MQWMNTLKPEPQETWEPHIFHPRGSRYVCMYVCMDGWMDGWMDVCMYACIYIYILYLGGGNSNIFLENFTPINWGRFSLSLTGTYFSNGWSKPPTRILSTWNLFVLYFWGLNPPKQGPFPINIRVIWVLGISGFYLFFHFQPENWGRWIHFDYVLFFKGV